MAWPTFELSTGTNPYPQNAILDTHESVWQTRVNPVAGQDDIQYQLFQSLVFHVDVEPYSTTTAEYKAFMLQQFVLDPIIDVCGHGPTPGSGGDTDTGGVARSPSNPSRTGVAWHIKYTGTWQIERLSTDHDSGPGCRVSCVISTLGGWVDDAGVPVP